MLLPVVVLFTIIILLPLLLFCVQFSVLCGMVIVLSSFITGVFERAVNYFRTSAPELKEERAMLLDEWEKTEIKFGELGDPDPVRAKLPKKLKRRRQIENEDGPPGYAHELNHLNLSCVATVMSWLANKKCKNKSCVLPYLAHVQPQCFFFWDDVSFDLSLPFNTSFHSLLSSWPFPLCRQHIY